MRKMASSQKDSTAMTDAGAYKTAGVSVDENGTITVDEATIDAGFVPQTIGETEETAIAENVIGMINYNREDVDSSTPLWVAFGVDAPVGATKFSMGTELKVAEDESQYTINTAADR